MLGWVSYFKTSIFKTSQPLNFLTSYLPTFSTSQLPTLSISELPGIPAFRPMCFSISQLLSIPAFPITVDKLENAIGGDRDEIVDTTKDSVGVACNREKIGKSYIDKFPPIEFSQILTKGYLPCP